MSDNADGLVDIAIGHWKSKALFTAISSGLFECIDEGCSERKSLSMVLSWPQRSVEALVNSCIALELIEENPSGTLSLRPHARAHLLRKSPAYLGGWMLEEDRTFHDWTQLLECLRSGKPASGVDQHGYFVGPPESAGFLHGVSRRVAEEFCDFVSLDGCRVVDLGGGTGAFAEAIVTSCSTATVVLVDRPSVCGEARRRLRETPRVVVVEADFFEDPLPGDADLVLLANVLHDWTTEQNLKLISRTRDCLRQGGRVAIVEIVPPDDRAEEPLSSLISLSFCLGLAGGFAYSLKDYCNFLTRSGFDVAQCQPLSRSRKTLIVGRAQD